MAAVARLGNEEHPFYIATLPATTRAVKGACHRRPPRSEAYARPSLPPAVYRRTDADDHDQTHRRRRSLLGPPPADSELRRGHSRAVLPARRWTTCSTPSAIPSNRRSSAFGELADQGAGHPDFGLYAAKQRRKGQTPKDQKPECGVVEVKPISNDAWLTAESDQVSGYWAHYRLVLVTNYRDFVLLGEDAEGRPAKLEAFQLAKSAAAFDEKLEHPPRLRPRRWPRAGRVPLPRALPPRRGRRAAGPGLAARLLSPRQPGAGRSPPRPRPPRAPSRRGDSRIALPSDPLSLWPPPYNSPLWGRLREGGERDAPGPQPKTRGGL